MVNEKYGYYGTCLDFSVKEVQKYVLSYIEEQIMRFDVYGVEWDFMRETFTKCLHFCLELNAT